MFLLASLEECPRGCNLQLKAELLKIFFLIPLNSLSHSHLPTKSLPETKLVELPWWPNG